MSSCDVLIVSLGSTPGWRDADAKLRDLLTACGVATELVAAEPQPRVRTMMFTDYRWAAACRVAADAGVAKYNPRAVIYSTVTASLPMPCSTCTAPPRGSASRASARGRTTTS